jgi:glucose-6-phosphate 1-dehydrogenase
VTTTADPKPGEAAPAASPAEEAPAGRPAKDPPRTMRQLRLARQGKRRAPTPKLANPLREGLRLERMPDPACLVLFGATGDLAHRKVVPALYQLWRTSLLPHEFMLVAFARRPYDDETFRTEIGTALEKYSRVPVEPAIKDEFLKRIVYHEGDFADPAAFDSLATRLDQIDEEHGTHGNRLYYLATQSSAFTEVIAQLGRVGLDHEHHVGGWRRIVIEKPFGRDVDSAIRLNREVLKVFRETQVYRIDHYLGKETVRNLLVFRFGNGIFEPLWNRRYVDHVQITVAESIGVENRSAFYEETGASRDVLQNHLMQLLTLVAMEPPATFEADPLRDEKVKVLRAIAPFTRDEVRTDVVRGQYGPGWVAAQQVPGYRDEPKVDPASETETFVAARFEIDDWRWAGVPFYVRTGKRLPKRASEIAIQFRPVPHRLFKDSSVDPEPNLLALRIQPDEGILLRFGAKVPGLGLDVRAVNMDFTYGSAFNMDSPDAYETLILDALLGDASLFTRADEVEEAWGIVTPIIDAWLGMAAPEFPNYEAGSWGPTAADELMERDGRRWRRI